MNIFTGNSSISSHCVGRRRVGSTRLPSDVFHRPLCQKWLHLLGCYVKIATGKASGLVILIDKIQLLIHWGRVMYICISKLAIIGSDNGLSPGRRQALIWTNARILLIGPLRKKKCSEILIKTYIFSLKKSILKCHLENGSHFVSASMC